MGFTFRKWTDSTIEREIMKIANQFDPPKMPSNREAKEMYGGYGLAMAISKNGGFKYWADKLGLPPCDFYIFRELDTNITYIVPAHICSGQVQVTMAIGNTKYAPYKEAWDLIGKMSDYYKAIES